MSRTYLCPAMNSKYCRYNTVKGRTRGFRHADTVIDAPWSHSNSPAISAVQLSYCAASAAETSPLQALHASGVHCSDGAAAGAGGGGGGGRFGRFGFGCFGAGNPPAPATSAHRSPVNPVAHWHCHGVGLASSWQPIRKPPFRHAP
jgi:hypothetical protein